MTYTELRAAIQDYCENFEATFAERIDTFIRQAESRIAHIVRLPPFRKWKSGPLTAGEPLVVPPTDYLSPDMFVVIDPAGESYDLQNKEPEFIYACYPVLSSRGRPRYYAKLDDKTLLVGPTPDLAYDSLLHYFAYAESICDSPTGRSYLGDRCESLLLYAGLVEAYTFMKGEMDLLVFYDKKFQEAVGLFKQLGDGRARKDSHEEPDRRVPV